MKFFHLLLPFLLCFQLFSDSITLPIEVLGKSDHTETINLNLNSDPSLATGLKLRVHGLTYENKASIKINNGDWIPLNDTNVVYPKIEAAYWGMGGTQSTLNFIVPLTNGEIKASNTIAFKFNNLDNLTVGYRVLDINVTSAKRNLSLKTVKIQDNPRFWKPISTNESEIIKGRELWFNAKLRDGGVNGKMLSATCSDCHSYSGKDLKYFNYSDKSIIARSMFHEISEEDSKSIASYIRNLKIPYQNNGRPWNPPYQPGRALDNYPIANWAAGAGLDSVLDDDLKTLDYIFPTGPDNGVNYTDGTAKFDFKKTLNAREMPLAIQLPDWNSWLPKVHPIDAYPEIFTNGHPFLEIYNEAKTRMAGKSKFEAGKIFNSMKSRWDKYSTSGLKRPEREDPAYNVYVENLKGIRHWRAVKTFELMTEFGLEDLGNEIFGKQSNDRRWFDGNIFSLAPHMLGEEHIDTFAAKSAQWYTLQIVLNDGNRLNPSIAPIDWGYAVSLNFSSFNNPLNMPFYGLAVWNAIKAGESVENGLSITNRQGWNPYRLGLPLMLGGNYNKQLNQVPLVTRQKIGELLTKAWLEKADSYSKQDYIISQILETGDGQKFKEWVQEIYKRGKTLKINEGLLNKLNEFNRKIYSENIIF